jgi:hypothetical protein
MYPSSNMWRHSPFGLCRHAPVQPAWSFSLLPEFDASGGGFRRLASTTFRRAKAARTARATRACLAQINEMERSVSAAPGIIRRGRTTTPGNMQPVRLREFEICCRCDPTWRREQQSGIRSWPTRPPLPRDFVHSGGQVRPGSMRVFPLFTPRPGGRSYQRTNVAHQRHQVASWVKAPAFGRQKGRFGLVMAKTEYGAHGA